MFLIYFGNSCSLGTLAMVMTEFMVCLEDVQVATTLHPKHTCPEMLSSGNKLFITTQDMDRCYIQSLPPKKTPDRQTRKI